MHPKEYNDSKSFIDDLARSLLCGTKGMMFYDKDNDCFMEKSRVDDNDFDGHEDFWKDEEPVDNYSKDVKVEDIADDICLIEALVDSNDERLVNTIKHLKETLGID